MSLWIGLILVSCCLSIVAGGFVVFMLSMSADFRNDTTPSTVRSKPSSEVRDPAPVHRDRWLPL